jgi:hypothetical protein
MRNSVLINIYATLGAILGIIGSEIASLVIILLVYGPEITKRENFHSRPEILYIIVFTALMGALIFAWWFKALAQQGKLWGTKKA